MDYYFNLRGIIILKKRENQKDFTKVKDLENLLPYIKPQWGIKTFFVISVFIAFYAYIYRS